MFKESSISKLPCFTGVSALGACLTSPFFKNLDECVFRSYLNSSLNAASFVVELLAPTEWLSAGHVLCGKGVGYFIGFLYMSEL